MVLREPVSATWILISLLILIGSGELFGWMWTDAKKDCHLRNERLLADQREGPLQQCWEDTP